MGRACEVGEEKCVHFWLRNPKERDHLEVIEVDGKML